jgi:hypothetical protein
MTEVNAEQIRLSQERLRKQNWKRWGPYLAEREWATVREDYSYNGDSWHDFPIEHAPARAYRWGEDGLLGLTDRECRLCFALAFWNEQDAILKERLFGLVPNQANHGEDVKECYYYLDSTPTHSYMKALYKYPQNRFPYEKLIEENQKRGLSEPEYELLDTGIFDNNEYFDIFVEYAKCTPDDILIRVTIANRNPRPAPLYFLPTLWMRNIWAWGSYSCTVKQTMRLERDGLVLGKHESLGNFFFSFPSTNSPSPLFTENATNFKKLYGIDNPEAFVKDAFHDYVIHGNHAAVNPALEGSKFAPLYKLDFQGSESKTFDFRLLCAPEWNPLEGSHKGIFEQRQKEADAFYEKKMPPNLSFEEKSMTRQAFASLLWSKQFYHYVVQDWLAGDPLQPQPPQERMRGRNKEWPHLFCYDVISVPDKWEYPWFASWDLAFHMIPFAKIDPDFAKNQILLFLREWYMHPNGQQPAYEYEFSEVNPPVHAWAAWRIYKMTGPKGSRDIAFLESAFQKLLLNFTWWVNKKDREGHNLFSGGFLGLDNIGVFDRSKIAHQGMVLEQADGTGWMAFYCLTMLTIALELAVFNPVYEDMASKFFEHFTHIADAINQFGGTGLWDEEDGFYYDQLKQNGHRQFIKTRSLVGLLPLIAVEILEDRHLEKHKGFMKRMHWFLNHRKDLQGVTSYCTLCSSRGHRILAIPSKERLQRIFRYLFDENEFLSPFGIRSLSKYYGKHPFKLSIGNKEHWIEYVPGVSNTTMFGGNSNWRGPIWFPINFLLIEALERYDYFYGESLKVEYPTGSGRWLTLKQVADDLSKRLVKILLPDSQGRRPCFNGQTLYAQDPYWKELVLFFEYFHAETGEGLGACHQTGWTALITHLLKTS